MTTYIVDFQSGGAEINPSIPGKTSISLPRNTVNSGSTSLALTGLGTSLYGEYQQENFIRLLENFASKIAPLNPTIGQIWFDSTANKAKIFSMAQIWEEIGNSIIIDPIEPATSLEGQLWFNAVQQVLYLRIDPNGVHKNLYPLYFGTWVQIWPQIMSYAGILEYNQVATRLNRVVGQPTTFGGGALEEIQWGWGETDLVPTFISQNNPTAFDNKDWLIFQSRLKKALRHLDQLLAPELAVPITGLILDGRGDGNATAALYSPATVWASGWADGAIATQAVKWAAIQTALDKLEQNRFSINTADTTWSVIDTTARPSWASTKYYTATVQFGSELQAKKFFNAGGQLKFNISNFGGSGGLTTEWINLLTANGTNVNDYSSAGFVIDWKGSKLGSNGAYIGGAGSIGYYDLTSSFSTLHSVARGGAYGSGSLVFEAKTSLTGGWAIDVQISFIEDFNIGTKVDGTTQVVLQARSSTGITGGSPTISSPSIIPPTATTSGSFKTDAAE